MTWMQRLKRVFAIEIDTCQRCGGRLRVIASIASRAPPHYPPSYPHYSRRTIRIWSREAGDAPLHVGDE